MSYLIDVNVWVALALAGHTHHLTALRWIEDTAPDHLFFCRTTQQGLLRLLTNSHVMGENVLSAAQAWRVYDAFRQDDRVNFAEEPSQLEQLWRAGTRLRQSGTNYWTDTYLAAFAIASGHTIVTFDHAFNRMRGVRAHIL
jgi:hypothetical protein